MDFVERARPIAVELVGGRGHYERVVQAVMEARRSVWIATANLKELMVEDHRAAPGRRRSIRAGGRGARTYRSIMDVFAELTGRGVELRILHAGIPSGPFQAALKKNPKLLRGGLSLRVCPRVHFKAVVVDGGFVYLGSANWTGAGLGAKGSGRRNFELGFASADDGLLDRVQEIYDQVWRGNECKACKLRDKCPKPIDTLIKS
jgi:phosphatidylserine/phosphatidylglycerophosphate/cardiolipin synthase-like enzyme